MSQASPKTINQDGRQQCKFVHGPANGVEVFCE